MLTAFSLAKPELIKSFIARNSAASITNRTPMDSYIQYLSATGSRTITNLFTNPSIETDTIGWSAYNTATIAQSTAQFYAGSNSLSVVVTGGANRGVQSALITGLTSDVTYMISFYSYASSGVNIDAQVDTYTTLDAYVNSFFAATVTGNNGWQRSTISVSTAGSATKARLFVYTSSNTTFYTDAAQFELGSLVTSYFDGTSVDIPESTFAWTGTAHASTSTNTANAVGNLEDREARWLLANGATGDTQHDRWVSYLAAKGFVSGSLKDRARAFFTSGTET